MASVFKGDILTTFGIEKISQLSKDTMFRVRKAIAAAIGVSSALVGEEVVTSQLVSRSGVYKTKFNFCGYQLPIFLNLTNDDIWGVRKACAESIVAISNNCSRSARLDQLTPVYLELIKDVSFILWQKCLLLTIYGKTSRWVRNSTYQQLGPFIASLDGEDIPPKLLEHYIGMVEGTRSQYGDSDTVKFCAFSFPGVLLTLGKEKWPTLQPIYATLTEDLQWKVRRTLSHSLHEVAKILGTELTETHLLSTFELFLKDLDQV